MMPFNMEFGGAELETVFVFLAPHRNVAIELI
jgi:hypothetical protein